MECNVIALGLFKSIRCSLIISYSKYGYNDIEPEIISHSSQCISILAKKSRIELLTFRISNSLPSGYSVEMLTTCHVSQLFIHIYVLIRPFMQSASHVVTYKSIILWDFMFSRRRVWCSELSYGIFYTAVYPRRQLWTKASFLPKLY
jgi:hypothetical protein